MTIDLDKTSGDHVEPQPISASGAGSSLRVTGAQPSQFRSARSVAVSIPLRAIRIDVAIHAVCFVLGSSGQRLPVNVASRISPRLLS
jgi:hypothetical protein